MQSEISVDGINTIIAANPPPNVPTVNKRTQYTPKNKPRIKIKIKLKYLNFVQ